MASVLEQLLGLLPATSGGYVMNRGHKLLQDPNFKPANSDLAPIVHYPARVSDRLVDALADRPLSENVDDRRVSDKTLLGYRKLIDALDKAGYTQVRQTRAFAQRPTAEEMSLLRAAGEVPQKATPTKPEDLPFVPVPEGADLLRQLELIRKWQGRK